MGIISSASGGSAQPVLTSRASFSSAEGAGPGFASHPYSRKRARSTDEHDERHQQQLHSSHSGGGGEGGEGKAGRQAQGGWPHAPSSEEEPEAPEMSRYVGQNSIPALLRDQPSPMETKGGVDIRRDMRPILGLDNSAAFPLTSAKHLDRMTQDIFTQLPSDREVMK